LKYRGYYLHVKWLNTVISPEDIFKQRFIDSPFAHPSVMFRKEIMQKYGGYRDGDFPEDYELWLRWMQQGVKMAKIECSLLHWHDHPNRLSRTQSKYSDEALFKLKARYFSSWLHDQPHLVKRPIFIWGIGSSVYKKCKWLMEFGIEIHAFIDSPATNRKTWFKERPVYLHTEIPENALILSYVGDRNGKKLIKDYLKKKGKLEGTDYFMMT
jgi:hypothetical protein